MCEIQLQIIMHSTSTTVMYNTYPSTVHGTGLKCGSRGHQQLTGLQLSSPGQSCREKGNMKTRKCQALSPVSYLC